MSKRAKMRVIITGATGMVGEGVLHECVLSSDVEQVLVINRKPCGVEHPKVKEVLHPDFFDLSEVAHEMTGFDACFFCLGISSVGVSKDVYFKTTHTLTLHFAETVCRNNPGMTFIYVSGAGTDSTEKGNSNWARVKGKTENDLMGMPFKRVYAFRPGFMLPTQGLKNANSYYKLMNWIYPLGKRFYRVGFSTLKEVGQAMINVVKNEYPKQIIDGNDIAKLSK